MPITRIPTHRFFDNGSDDDRYRDAQVVAALCDQFGLSEDEAIDFLTRAGLVRMAKQNASVDGVPCWRILELARKCGITMGGGE